LGRVIGLHTWGTAVGIVIAGRKVGPEPLDFAPRNVVDILAIPAVHEVIHRDQRSED
jgi:hypothetical protein